MDKDDVVHIYKGILTIKKNKIMPSAATNEPRDCHTEWSKSDTDKYHMILLICGILKKGTTELIYKVEVELRMQKTNLWLPGNGRER